MKNRSIANELRVSYHRNEKLSVEDVKSVTSSKLLERVFRKIWNTDELMCVRAFTQSSLTIDLMWSAIARLPTVDWIASWSISDC